VQFGLTYYYVVSTISSGGVEGPQSPQVSVTFGTQIGTPTGLLAVPLTSSISLDWNPVPGAASYNVKRSVTRFGTYGFLKSSVSSDAIDFAVQPGTTYWYKVSAVSGTGQESPDSSEVSASLGAPPSLPAPTGLQAEATATSIRLTWNVTNGALNYNVKRSTTAGGPYEIKANVAATTYTDTQVQAGITYYYVVSAVGTDGLQGPNSSQVFAMTLGTLVAPAGLAATVTAHSVTLTWNAVPVADGYKIRRGTLPDLYDRTFTTTGTSYGDNFVVTNITYYYVVIAVKGTQESAPSAPLAATQR
jgi:fibronectin type 3 domain-containing protein